MLTSIEEYAAEIVRLRDRLRVLSDATHAFAEATTNFQQLVDGIAHRLADVIGDTCSVFVLCDDGTRLDPVSICAPDENATAAIRKLLNLSPLILADHSGPRHVVETGETLLIPKLDPALLRAHASKALLDYDKNFNIHSLLMVPLRLHARTIGVLSLSRYRKESPPFDDYDRELAQSLADHAALAIGNARAYQEAQQAREYTAKAQETARVAGKRFSRLVEAGIIGTCVHDLNGTALEIDDTLANMLGYSREEILSPGFRWTDLTPLDWKPVDAIARAQLATTGIAKVREKQYVRKNGERVWVMAGSAMLEETSQMISFVLDISERKRAEEEAQRLRFEHEADVKFRDLVEATPDALVILNPEGRIAVVNLQTERLFGYTRDELLGQPIEILIPENFHETVSSLAKTDFAVSQVGVDREVFGKRKNGSEFPIEITMGPLNAGSSTLVATAIRDVTERRKLEEQRARLATLVESAADAIIGTTLDGVVTTWNGGAQRLFGYAPDEILGKNVAILVPPGRETEKALIVDHIRLGEEEHTDTVRRAKDGRDIDVAVTWSPVRDARGKVIGTSKWARGISARKEAERALARAKESADTANRELEAFSYSVAHDLRAPLRGMNGFAQVLLDTYADKLDAEGKDWLQEILLNARRMGELIDALLSLSRVTRSALRHERVDLSSTAHSVLSHFANVDPKCNVEVVVERELSADVDPTLIRALLDNLIGNAWKFSSKNAAPKIKFGATDQNGERVFFVRDNGAGFDMTFAQKLFTPFQRLHAHSEFPGTGIGLANVQRIVHRHGGRVWAEGEVGIGATFYFTLPTRTTEATP